MCGARRSQITTARIAGSGARVGACLADREGLRYWWLLVDSATVRRYTRSTSQKCVRKAIGAGGTIRTGSVRGVGPDEVWWAMIIATSRITARVSLAARSLFWLCVLPIRIRFMPL